MKFSFSKIPVDILLCMVWSVILLPISLLEVEGALRVILGLPFILFIPGYMLIFALFPTKKTDRGIDIVERIALSFGLSIAVVPLIGLGLNYTPWGIRLEPILISIFIFIIGIGFIGFYRWLKTSSDERFIISVNLTFPKSERKLDKALTIILVLLIITAVVFLIYVIIVPKTGEKFTEFYLLGPLGQADEYPKDLTVRENTSVIIGVVNHEYKTVNYTIEIWLINQTIVYNEITEENQTIYHHMWYMNKINITLDHTPIKTEGPWMPQWEYNYNFSINRKGNFKLAFLLFTDQTEQYEYEKDYKNIAEQKINNAYRGLHLWLTVT